MHQALQLPQRLLEAPANGILLNRCAGSYELTQTSCLGDPDWVSGEGRTWRLLSGWRQQMMVRVCIATSRCTRKGSQQTAWSDLCDSCDAMQSFTCNSAQSHRPCMVNIYLLSPTHTPASVSRARMCQPNPLAIRCKASQDLHAKADETLIQVVRPSQSTGREHVCRLVIGSR